MSEKPLEEIKEKVCVTLDPKSLEWLRAQVEKGVYASVSHGLRVCVHNQIIESKKLGSLIPKPLVPISKKRKR